MMASVNARRCAGCERLVEPEEAVYDRNRVFAYCSSVCRRERERAYDRYVDPLGVYSNYDRFIDTHD